jgi:hypothetical protein
MGNERGAYGTAASGAAHLDCGWRVFSEALRRAAEASTRAVEGGATMSNVINKKIEQWSTPSEAIGSMADEPAISIADPQSMISLLKALLRDTAPAAVEQRVAALEPRMDALESRVTALEEEDWEGWGPPLKEP